MIDLKKMTINMLCKFGKFGVGKSLILGLYDFEPPARLIIDNYTLQNNKNGAEKVDEIYHDA